MSPSLNIARIKAEIEAEVAKVHAVVDRYVTDPTLAAGVKMHLEGAEKAFLTALLSPKPRA